MDKQNDQHLIMTKAYNLRYWRVLKDGTQYAATEATANEVEVTVLGLYNDNGLTFTYPEEKEQVDMLCYMLTKTFNNGRVSIRKEFNDLMKGNSGDAEVI